MSPRVAIAALGLLSILQSSCASVYGEQPRIAVPPGFRSEVFASGLGSPRFMAQDPAGTLLVSIPSQGRILALPDRNGDGRADQVATVVEGLASPHGLAFRDGLLYVAETGKVLRLRWDPRGLRGTDPVVVVPDLPPGGGHWTRTVVFGPDGHMYVSVGSSCNVCQERDPRRAAVLRYRPDGSGETLFATGLRNAVGLALHPETGALWATVNERDWRGDDLPPDYVTHVKEGGFYGWPDCYVVGGRAVPDARGARCDRVTPPTVEIQAHSAPLGLAFYTGGQFPAEYRGDLFVAYQGSWNRSVRTGYKVVRIRFRDGTPRTVEDFATGWLADGRVLGRPVDVLVGGDGSLYISDQNAGQIHRITYRP